MLERIQQASFAVLVVWRGVATLGRGFCNPLDTVGPRLQTGDQKDSGPTFRRALCSSGECSAHACRWPLHQAFPDSVICLGWVPPRHDQAFCPFGRRVDGTHSPKTILRTPTLIGSWFLFLPSFLEKFGKFRLDACLVLSWVGVHIWCCALSPPLFAPLQRHPSSPPTVSDRRMNTTHIVFKWVVPKCAGNLLF
eukprot:3342578-Amphidinium_carterae.1